MIYDYKLSIIFLSNFLLANFGYTYNVKILLNQRRGVKIYDQRRHYLFHFLDSCLKFKILLQTILFKSKDYLWVNIHSSKYIFEYIPEARCGTLTKRNIWKPAKGRSLVKIIRLIAIVSIERERQFIRIFHLCIQSESNFYIGKR